MAEFRREYIGGWLVIEDPRLPWDGGMSDPSTKIVVSGEIGHIRWLLYQVAWREVVRRDLEVTLAAMAERAGVQYAPSRDAEQRNETNATNTK